ncbi:unnamed protein product [Ectocarpus sp. CCAP 1310/34]|nr:unnamed protein product [Ectocarpus sp. CCAP 1310/34]
MPHAPPPAETAAHFGPPSFSSAGGNTGGPAYLPKHSFFDLDEDEDDASAAAGRATAHAAAAPAPAVAAASGGGEDGVASAAEEKVRISLTGKLKDLLEKGGIKGQLKSFDMTFSRRTGRLPTKAEKEPMRHLYGRYDGLKHQIRDVEGLLVAHRQQHSPQLQYTPPQSPYTASPRGVRAEQPGSSATTPTHHRRPPPQIAPPPPRPPPLPPLETPTATTSRSRRASSSTSTSTSGGGRERGQDHLAPAPVGAVGSPGSVAGAVAVSAAAAAAAAASAASAAAAAGVGDGGRMAAGSGTTAAAAAAAAGGAGGPANDKLVQLNREKRVLHVMLKNFEKEFKEKNGREVGCPKDIAPVEGEYQKYKMIKKRLAQLTK